MDTVKRYDNIRDGLAQKKRLDLDDLKRMLKRVKSSRSIQWWKEDILQLLYEVSEQQKERDHLTAENIELKSAIALANKALNGLGESNEKSSAENMRLRAAINRLIEYRDRVGATNFQLEKADDFINLAREAL